MQVELMNSQEAHNRGQQTIVLVYTCISWINVACSNEQMFSCIQSSLVEQHKSNCVVAYFDMIKLKTICKRE